MQTATITIKNGYQPTEVHFQAQQPAQIIFQQEDSSPCLSEVQSTALQFKVQLAVGDTKTVTIDTSQPGEYEFACVMNMFHGKVVIDS
ncbi:cupredoxin domain-containing protein [Bombilactobacillus bombi]|uniref:Cupredoxin domain-containing protein n=1 Tax=Bombilactobacillus bombi TaxID=1303590 RepID=A0A417Z5B2_9LACO|nr:cupredoxin domain-containing protein [Bombilactobacillus bombi]RHW45439.1 cupredoxin domain-containing protein [Bombilactobacillus bombi]